MSDDQLIVLYEDNHLIAVNKQPGEIAQGDETGDSTLIDKIKLYIKKKYNKSGEVFLGTIHRLDRPASGVILYARTSKALTRMNQLFRDKKIEKIYWAVVGQRPSEDSAMLIHYLVKNEKQNKSYAYETEKPGTKQAILEYKIIGASERYFLLEVNLHTGRHHQIRCQLSKISCQIKGDLKYGYARSNENGGIHLHARKISFIHPVKNEKIEIIAEPPDERIWNLFSQG
ncbi:MAG: RNA pseudouridine synthase [Bacteroidota bacterium]